MGHEFLSSIPHCDISFPKCASYYLEEKYKNHGRQLDGHSIVHELELIRGQILQTPIRRAVTAPCKFLLKAGHAETPVEKPVERINSRQAAAAGHRRACCGLHRKVWRNKINRALASFAWLADECEQHNCQHHIMITIGSRIIEAGLNVCNAPSTADICRQLNSNSLFFLSHSRMISLSSAFRLH